LSTYEKIAGLHLEVEGYELEGRELRFSEEFTRRTTTIHLRGAGEEGLGEDVTYSPPDHESFEQATPLPLEGSYTIDSFSAALDAYDLFPVPPQYDNARSFRRWGFESAALDLALRQAGTTLAEAVGREPRPVNFVVSMRLTPFDHEGPETADRLLAVLERYPNTRFKLDPANSWTQELVDGLAATGAVDTFDLKGFYRGTPVDVDTDPGLYRMCAETVPTAWLEDADLTDETLPVLEPHRDRLTWDAPIHGVEDVEALRWKPKMINIKPSRFGPLRKLFDTYDYCEREGIRCYGGGQTELGVGRGQIQYLASLFHPDNPNDTAPAPYNEPQLPEGLPTSPLDPSIQPTGFRRQGS
jgi:hypothetical protein